MDCSVCTTMPVMLRPPRNTICGACYEGARSIINLINKLETDKGWDTITPPNSCKTLINASKWVADLKDTEKILNEEISYHRHFVTAFKEQMHTDIQLKPGNNEPSIPTHKAILAVRSEIFKNMLESDGCKAPPQDTITLPELNYEELESLLEFLYCGNLPKEKVEKHVHSLSIAADKYEIPYLQKFCERHMLRFMNASNVLDVLQTSDACSYLPLKETALNFIVKNMEDIVFSERYDEFALKNPHLCVQITRASFMDAKKNLSS